ncbi:MAG: helix-turn-helix transcriptional regulator [Chloroflexi bacterium]|nr:helix-turn-helix transcriptional regulator [Chloroflexota bacterium]
MGRRQQSVYVLEPSQFPVDFPQRLDEFRQAAGLSWRELARKLRVNVRTVHRWRRGAKPDAGHLLSLLALAADRGKLDTLLPCASQPSTPQPDRKPP